MCLGQIVTHGGWGSREEGGCVCGGGGGGWGHNVVHAGIQKGGPTLTTCISFFLVDDRREDPNSTKSGQSLARQL